MPAAINLLSGAAVETGLIPAIDLFRRQSGSDVEITFATTPEIRRLIAAGEQPDAVIAPPPALDELAKSGRVDGASRVLLGRVGIGVVIRDGAPKPDVSTVEALKRAVLDADSVVFNRASSGLYVETMLQRLGLAERIQPKTWRYTGTDMIEPLIKGSGEEIGFLPITQILNYTGRGLQLAGALPAEVQNHTVYAAEAAPKSAGGAAFVHFLATPESRRIFASAGIE